MMMMVRVMMKMMMKVMGESETRWDTYLPTYPILAKYGNA